LGNSPKIQIHWGDEERRGIPGRKEKKLGVTEHMLKKKKKRESYTYRWSPW
jgi:hypothetical protein